MNIGQKINEFDNSTGTVKDFNRIFNHTPLKSSRGRELVNGRVEIGGIAGAGKVTTRLLTLNVGDSERVFEYDLYPATANQPLEGARNLSEEAKKARKRRTRNQKPLFKYTVSKDNESWTYYNTGDAANKMGVSKSSVSQYLKGLWVNKNGYTIKKEENK